MASFEKIHKFSYFFWSWALRRLYIGNRVFGPELELSAEASIYRKRGFWAKTWICPTFSRKIDALTGVSLPQLRLRFVGKICYANQKMRCYASQRIQRATHVRILNSFVAICEVKSPCLITLLRMGSRGYMMIDRIQIEKSFGKVFGC